MVSLIPSLAVFKNSSAWANFPFLSFTLKPLWKETSISFCVMSITCGVGLMTIPLWSIFLPGIAVTYCFSDRCEERSKPVSCAARLPHTNMVVRQAASDFVHFIVLFDFKYIIYYIVSNLYGAYLRFEPIRHACPGQLVWSAESVPCHLSVSGNPTTVVCNPGVRSSR